MVRYLATGLGLAFGLAVLGSSALADNPPAGKITHTVNGNTDTWRIDEPDVTRPMVEFPQISFVPGDKVTVSGGGCVQTGGYGDTWKRYIDPLGSNSDQYYHGMVLIPGAIGQLPADNLANFARILIIKGQQFTVGAIDEPRTAHLWLGYEDDGYGDNGYYSQDAGTQGQCQIGGGYLEHAFAVVTIVHGGAPPPTPTARQFDLSVNTITANNPVVDPNDILFNPVWGRQLQQGHPLPNPTNCGSSNVPSDPVDCTSQTTNFDGTDLCTVRGWFTGDAGGHLNWAAATYQGSLYWEAHSAVGTDDDYNMRLVPPDQAGLTTDNGFAETTSEPSLGLEFDSDETIDHFHTPWWDKLHAAVDADDSAYSDYQGAIANHLPAATIAAFKAVFDNVHMALQTITNGKLAIVVGLVGLDEAHCCSTELHPVWAMAIRVKDDPGDEVWAMFVRRWGDEGFCSSDQHYLDDLQGDALVFRLPWRAGATGVTQAAGTQFLSRLGQATGPGVTPQPNTGVDVSFTMPVPQSGDGERVNGELHLHWTLPPGRTAVQPIGPQRFGSVSIATTGVGSLSPEAEEGEPEARVEAALNALTPAQLQTFRARLPAKVVSFDGQTPRAVAATAVAASAVAPVTALNPLRIRQLRRPPTTRAVPDPQKLARDQQRLAAFRAVSAVSIPLEDSPPTTRHINPVRGIQRSQ
jgi:hypothetical protein